MCLLQLTRDYQALLVDFRFVSLFIVRCRSRLVQSFIEATELGKQDVKVVFCNLFYYRVILFFLLLLFLLLRVKN